MSAKSVRKSAKEANEKLRETFKSKPQRQKSTHLEDSSDDIQQLPGTGEIEESGQPENAVEITDENLSDTSLD